MKKTFFLLLLFFVNHLYSDTELSFKPRGVYKILSNTSPSLYHFNPQGGFTHKNLTIPTADFKQCEIEASFDKVGMIAFEITGTAANKTFTTRRVAPVTPDGQFHRLCFFASDLELPPNGVITQIDFLWRNVTHVKSSIKRAVIRSKINLIPEAETLTLNETRDINYLLPGQKYKYNWIGKKPGAITLEYIDFNNTPIQTTSLSKNTIFTLPDTAMFARVTLTKTGEGIPQLSPSILSQRPDRTHYKPRWIWIQKGSGPEFMTAFFKKEFEVKGKVTEAVLSAAGDDLATCYLNGQFTHISATYKQPGFHTVTSLLKPGTNLLEVTLKNNTKAAALLLELYYKDEAGEHTLISDDSWQWSLDGKNWKKPVFSPSVFKKSWDEKMVWRPAQARPMLTILHQKPGEVEASFQGKHEQLLNLPKHLQFVIQNGTTHYEIALPVSLKLKANATVLFTYTMPAATLPTESQVFLNDEHLGIAGDASLTTLPAAPPGKGLARSFFTGIGERTVLHTDGEQRAPFFWCFPGFEVRYSKPEFLANAVASGFDNFLLRTDIPEFWKEEDSFDFTEINKRVLQICSFCPNARFMLQVTCSMPDHWLAKHPDDTATRNDGKKRDLNYERQALSSQQWLVDAQKPLKALVDYIAHSPWSNRVFACSLSENPNQEWFWWVGRTYDYTTGYSPADLQTFRNYLKTWYGNDVKALQKAWNNPDVTFETAQMPPFSIHRQGTILSLLDLNKDRCLVDWFHYRNESLATALGSLCNTVKECSDGRWMTGGYYGYFITQIMNGHQRPIHDQGHNATFTASRNPAIDFVRSPSRYRERRPGRPDGLVHLWDTWHTQGKTVFMECDHRTILRPDFAGKDLWVGRPYTLRENISVINRCFGIMAATGCPYYWYDITTGAYLNPAFEALFREQRQVWNALPPVQHLLPKEVAIVGDEKSVYCTQRNNGKDTLLNAIGPIYEQLNSQGYSYANLCTQDLLEEKTPSRKLYFMVNHFCLTRDERAALVQRFEREKATVVWMVAPGAFTPEEGPKAELCGDFLGIQTKLVIEKRRQELNLRPAWGGFKHLCANATGPWFYPVSGYDEVIATDQAGAPLVVLAKRNGATHIFSGATDLPHTLLWKIAQAAKVFQITADWKDRLWAGNDIVCLHTTAGGPKKLFAPPGTFYEGILGPCKGQKIHSGELLDTTPCTTYLFKVVKNNAKPTRQKRK